MTLHYAGAPRAVTALFGTGDRLVFHLEHFGDVGSIPLRELFWQAVRNNPARAKHPLQPRTCKGAKPGKRGPKPDAFYAKQYGVSSGVIGMWRRAGAPLADPDQMGDYIFTIKTRRRGAPRKVVLQ